MRRLVLMVALAGCARSDRDPATGSLGGPCYANGTCDEGLACGELSSCELVDPCAGITCSGHGSCVAEAGALRCECEAGYRASALRCLACGPVGCDTACPPDMIAVPGQPACIDRYEATVYATPDCTGERYGTGLGDDYPVGFPPVPSSSACSGFCKGWTAFEPTTQVYACSVAGVRPSAFINWFRARRACENSGKRLCSHAVWMSACAGEENQTYPYGAQYVAGVCVDSGSTPAIKHEGTCEGGLPGLYDMSGNVAEWIEDVAATGGGLALAPMASDGFAATNQALLSCGAWRAADVTTQSASLGFRCCSPR